MQYRQVLESEQEAQLLGQGRHELSSRFRKNPDLQMSQVRLSEQLVQFPGQGVMFIDAEQIVLSPFRSKFFRQEVQVSWSEQTSQFGRQLEQFEFESRKKPERQSAIGIDWKSHACTVALKFSVFLTQQTSVAIKTVQATASARFAESHRLIEEIPSFTLSTSTIRKAVTATLRTDGNINIGNTNTGNQIKAWTTTCAFVRANARRAVSVTNITVLSYRIEKRPPKARQTSARVITNLTKGWACDDTGAVRRKLISFRTSFTGCGISAFITVCNTSSAKVAKVFKEE
jgi:hypothetical protein